MTAKCFVDTGVLLSAKDPSDPSRQAKAVALIEELDRSRRLVISTQVVSEFHAALNRASSAAAIDALLDWQPEPVTEATLRTARELSRRYSLGWWDAMIAASGLLAGCTRIYSSQLEHGTHIDGLEVVNPFLP